jgi:DNA/RNA endonuclease G (NUC1)
LGGGKSARNYNNGTRVPIGWDNTLQARSRGDFAVPTLFNGNFDAEFENPSLADRGGILRNIISNGIAGWSFRNNETGATWANNVVNNGDLEEWRNIDSLSENRIAVGYQKNSSGQFIDVNGNPVVNLNIKSLKDALIGIGYSDVAGDNLKDRNNKRVTGLEFNLLLNDMQSVGYTIVNGSLLYLGQAVVGIDIDTLGDHLSTLQYSVNSDGNLVNQNNVMFINKNKIITLQNKLKALIKESYLQRLGINANSQPNYALKLEGGDVATHNRFLVPAWGSLRFDLHVPDVENFNVPTTLNNLKVFITSGNQEYELSSRVIIKNPTVDGQPGDGSRIGSREKGIEILFDDDPTNTGYAANRIGFGSAGFETFDLDIPDEFRGKVATLRFELEQDSPDVYLDNVFLQSQHLALGNPTNARIQYNPNLSEAANGVSNDVNRENYLVEKPQYTVSYNDITKTANWASWQLNKSWLGAEPRTNLFEQDRTLPSIWGTLQGSGDINGNPDQYGERYDRGHLAASGDRTRNEKDNYATFLMSNMVPQNEDNNREFAWWRGTEDFSRRLVNNGKELYIIAGVYGQKSTLENPQVNVPSNIWKVIVVMDKPGQTLADVNLSTMAFAIDLPNKNPANDLVVDQNGNLVSPTNWRDYVISIRELESRLEDDESGLHYDFLSNVSTFIQDIVENRNKTTILNWINANNPTAPLLADPAIPNSITTGINLTIGHDGFVENNVLVPIKVFSPTQIGITQIGISDTPLNEVGTFENGTSEIGIFNASLPKIGIAEVSPFHQTVSKSSFIQTNSSELSKAEIGFFKTTPIKIGIGEVGFSIDTSKASTFVLPMRTSKVPSGEIPVSPSSVLSHQLLSVHDATPQIITSLDDTATKIWSGLIQSPTPFNLKIEVTDLSTGQLAEATITGYDSNGRPNSGTLTLDTDGNSLGWFIDTTPDDNTEFDQNLTPTAFRATTGAAAGKYDLLTTILHELGHLNGIISGNTAFDTHVQRIDGIPTFIDGLLTATLTPDGSHLDSTLYPYDLMNTSLKPGIRKLPSALDFSILNALWSNE